MNSIESDCHWPVLTFGDIEIRQANRNHELIDGRERCAVPVGPAIQDGWPVAQAQVSLCLDDPTTKHQMSQA